MALRSFKVENHKGLILAECAAVPPLMIICGPNGSGKSTLLYSIKQGSAVRDLDPNTDVFYQPPHRVVRRQAVQRRYLGGALSDFSGFLKGDAVAGVEGLQIPYPTRTPDNVDESGSTLKFVLGKLENRRQNYLASKVDEAVASGAKHLDLASVSNIYEPLDRLVRRLLPHLQFRRVDFGQEDNIRCVFIRQSGDAPSIELDLDDLSSGEKAILILFMPLIEKEINDKLSALGADMASASAVADRVFLLDEPELHLHPDLQRRMLSYLRERAAEGGVQFLLVSHSPTLLDGAADNELYILQLAKSSQLNQLQRVATSSERLDALRELTGESYFVTTGRNIVCVEGETFIESGNKATDVGLIEVLHDRASRYTFVPMGGKSQVLAAVTRLRDGLPPSRHGVAVVGLVDEDQGSTYASAVTWARCEIENLLVRAPAIIAAVGELAPRYDPPLTVDAAEELLAAVAQTLKAEEINLRVHAKIGRAQLKPKGSTAEEIRQSYHAQVDALAASLTDERYQTLSSEASAAVDGLITSGDFKARFRGKRILRELLKLLSLPNVSYEQFCYALARATRALPDAHQELTALFDSLDALVNEQLAALYESEAEPSDAAAVEDAVV